MIEILPWWAFVPALGLMAFFALRAVTLMGSLLDLGTDVPTRRVVLNRGRRATRLMGGFIAMVGVLTMPGDGVAPLMMGAAMIGFPAMMNADALKIFIPAADHREPIGPQWQTSWPQSYVRPAGPITLAEWLLEP